MGEGVFLGLTTVDIVSYVHRYPGSNEKLQADSQRVYAGGPAANAAVACAALGTSVSLITGLGNTVMAGLARDDLQRHNVKIIDWVENTSALPVLSSITVDESCGDRSVVYTNTATRMLQERALPENILVGASVVLLDGYYQAQAIKLAESARDRGIPVVIDCGSWKDGLDKVLPRVDYAICSENFLPPGCTDIESIITFLADLGIRRIAVSKGGRPLYAFDDGRETEISVQSVDVRDTLGAGDILHGAFCHFIARHDFFTSLLRAMELASVSCKYRGAREWIEYYIAVQPYQ